MLCLPRCGRYLGSVHLAKGIEKKKEENVMGDVKTENNPMLWQMEGIDTAVGLKCAGNDAELYRDILMDYADCIEEQAGAIERALTEEDIETFTIEVHSLKSISRTIGALKLSDQAKELEEYGKRREWGLIKDRIYNFLSDYRALYSVIMPYYIRDKEEEGKKPVDREIVSGLLSDFSVSLEEYDYSRMEKILSDLSEYDFTEGSALYMETLRTATDKFDYEACRKTVMQWRQEF